MEQLTMTGLPQREAAAPGTVRDSTGYEMTSGEIAHARAFVRRFLDVAQSQHGMTVSARAVEIAQLVVSELATNVCRYAPGPCLLDLESDGALLDIVIWDSGPVLPAASPADPTRVGQHGLELVLMLCTSFAIHREPVGKRIRVQIPLHDDSLVPSAW
ncbi:MULTISPECIES: ATP-binding protein [unclassified Streptomyces]|uniref:ATP-binding protein n=1 Tax=unclassified Streptomyces TaxID=2593676 RepID=UPI00255213A4|nr:MULTISPECIES: ATP-binding protein [unclassified Streptomyces]WRZ62453.1 ATP-binding protein [Streptomyces sp. NBC_01257]WSU56423.1 ATP-binding protein [Streptomyces sp. NBC_01104]